jgi:hypothetical protein
MATAPAQADEPPTPGPTVYADPNSPTGYTGRFVYYDPTATSVRFVADILLRDWENPTNTTVYQPSQYRPGLMRGAGAYDVQMTNDGNGYWITEVPLAAGPTSTGSTSTTTPTCGSPTRRTPPSSRPTD